MSLEVQSPQPVASALRMSGSHRPGTGCLSLQQLKELYSQRASSGSPSGSPLSSPGSSPCSSPRRLRAQSQFAKAQAQAQAPSSSQSSSPVRSRLSRHVAGPSHFRSTSESGRRCSTGAEQATEPAGFEHSREEDAVEADLRSEDLASAAPDVETAKQPRGTILKSHSLQSDRMTATKTALKSAILLDRELRHAKSLIRRVSFSAQVEVIVYQ